MNAEHGILAFHASPDDDNRYLVEEVHDRRLVRARPEIIRSRLGDISARIVLYGSEGGASDVEPMIAPAVLVGKVANRTNGGKRVVDARPSPFATVRNFFCDTATRPTMPTRIRRL